jgi:hypothetical protein
VGTTIYGPPERRQSFLGCSPLPIEHAENVPRSDQNRKGQKQSDLRSEKGSVMKYEWFQKKSNWLYCHSSGAIAVAQIELDQYRGRWVAYDLTAQLTREICAVKDLLEAKIAAEREFIEKAAA